MTHGHCGPLGHKFNTDLVCACGRSFEQHAKKPRLCPLVSAQYNRQPKPDSTPLENLRVAMGMRMCDVAEQCGVSEETARRAIHGDVGGRHRTSPETSERVEQFITDMATAA